jgi:uncharacterized protein (DUF169 family)
MMPLAEPGCLSSAAKILTDSLHLRRPPVAISLTDHVPAGVSAHGGLVPAGCRFWEDAADRAFYTTASEHSLCAVGIYTHNLQPSPRQQVDLMDALRVFGELGYVRPEDLPLIPTLRSRHEYVVYSPLATAPTAPDAVVLFVDAAQTLILSEATQQVELQTAPAMGRPACAVIPQVLNTGRAALSLGCCGARAYLGVLPAGDSIFALPGQTLGLYVERVEALAKANRLLSTFHQLRRQAVESGQTPTVQESLAALMAQGSGSS